MNEAPSLLLDTHIWLRYQGISGDLLPAVLPLIHEAAGRGGVYVSIISVWEIAQLARLSKIALNTDVHHWIGSALSKPGIQLLTMTPEIAIESVNLPEPMHKDPADRILVASARVERLTLVTRDREILLSANALHLSTLRA